MKNSFTLFSGIFFVMALSNAIVPVLPAYTGSSSLQGAIFAAYFLGAFLSTLPAGMLADRYGNLPLIRSGFIITIVSGFLLSVMSIPFLALAARFTEGIGAGCFIAASMSLVNTREDHVQTSGYFLALLNTGLVLGLILAGWLAQHSGIPAAGVLLFASLALVPAGTSFLLRDTGQKPVPFSGDVVCSFLRDYRWLWIAAVVLIGITGAISSLYPQFSQASPESLGYWIAGMNVATIIAVLMVSRLRLSPLNAIRGAAFLMSAGVMLCFYTPWGFAVLGALAGIVMIVQMAYLAGEKEHQGAAMGLFSSMSYLGMTLLPFLAGVVAERAGFFTAFSLTAFAGLLVALTIGFTPSRTAHRPP